MKPKARILVVDDEKPIANMMQQLLSVAGYEVDVVYRGEAALAQVLAQPPDLILLDVMMPEMDGYEVCRTLKANPDTAIIPIIMTTSLAERKQRQEGMEAGADDYLTKPIEPNELVLRVANAVRMKSLYDDLQRSYGQLRSLEALRDHLVHLIVHDMRTPLQAVTGYLQLLESRADERQLKFLKMALESSAILTRLTDDLLVVHQMENGQMELRRVPTSVGAMWAEARPALEAMATMQEVEMVSLLSADSFPLEADVDLLQRVLINLVGNALKYTPRRGLIEITAQECGPEGVPGGPDSAVLTEAAGAAPVRAWVVVSVLDTGPGIPPEYYQKIFEKFGVVEAMQAGTRRSTGLGLTFCKLAVEAHGGRIGVESELQQGCRFWFALPLR